jgi:hypothetical protein
MKTKSLTIVCAAAIGFASAAPALAQPEDPAVVAGDALIVRPLSFVATVLGSAVFVVSLPVAATSHSIGWTADSLVVAPAQFTFTRALGDFEYSYSSPDPTMAVAKTGHKKAKLGRHARPIKD